MTLPDDLAHQYVDEMDAFEEKQRMTYISFAERLAQEKGFHQGIEQGIERGVEQGVTRRSNSIDHAPASASLWAVG